MRIGIDASRANIKNKTGVEWYSYNLIESFKKIDHSNEYFLYSQTELNDKLKELPSNFKSIIIPWNKKKFWTQLKLPKFVNKNKNRILFISSGIIPVWPLFFPFKRYKTITTIHDVCFLDNPQYYSKKDLFLQKLGLKLATIFAKKILTVSNFTKEQILKHVKCKAEKIIVTHLGYDKNIYNTQIDQDEATRIRKKYDLPEKFILYIGRIEEKKNIINQIIAFNKFNQKYPEYKFVLIGKSGYGYDAIRTEMFENGLHKNIIELGWIKSEDVAVILKMSAIFMFVSSYEGFGLPIIEAMACGIPVITSKFTSMPEVADDAALFNEPNNTLGIYENLCNIIENTHGIKDELIKKGFERIKEFDWEECAKKTVEVFDSFNKKK